MFFSNKRKNQRLLEHCSGIFRSTESPGPSEVYRKFDLERRIMWSAEHGCSSNTFQICFPESVLSYSSGASFTFVTLERHSCGTWLTGQGDLCHWFANFKCALCSTVHFKLGMDCWNFAQSGWIQNEANKRNRSLLPSPPFMPAHAEVNRCTWQHYRINRLVICFALWHFLSTILLSNQRAWVRGQCFHPLLWDFGPEVPLTVVYYNHHFLRRHLCHNIGKSIWSPFILFEWEILYYFWHVQGYHEMFSRLESKATALQCLILMGKCGTGSVTDLCG